MSVSLTKSLKPTSKAQLRKGAKLPLERKVFYDYFIFSDSKMVNLESESIPKSSPMWNLSGKILKVFNSRLSRLPIDIFETSECVCGHGFHSPRLTLALAVGNEIVSSTTVFFFLQLDLFLELEMFS